MTEARNSQPPKPRPVPPPPPAARSGKPLPLGVWVGVGVGAAVVLLGVLFFVMLMVSKDSLPPVVAASETDRTKDRRRRSLPSETDIDFLSQREKARKELAAKEENLVTPKFGNTAAPKRLGPAVTENPKTEYKDLGPWNQDILAKNRFLPLPERPQTVVITENKPKEISKINVHNPTSINLQIHSPGGKSKEQGLVFRVNDEESDKGEKLRRWIVQRKAVDPFTKQVQFGEVGTFELADQSLSFAWNMEAPPWTKPLALQFCLLEIIHNGQSELCQLSQAKIVPPTKLLEKPDEIFGKDKVIPLAIKSNAVDDPKSLRLSLSFEGFNNQKIPDRKGAQDGG